MDTELDALFQSSAGTSSSVRQSVGQSASSPARPQHEDNARVEAPTSHSKASTRLKRKERELNQDSSSLPSTKDPKKRKVKEKGKKRLSVSTVDDSGDDDVDPPKTASPVDPPLEKESDSASDGDDPNHIPQHESLSKKGKRPAKTKKVKYVPEGEAPAQRDARTIFVGNVPIEVSRSKPLTKSLKRHILSSVPSAKIESIRFRSVAFKNPTASLPKDDDDDDSSKKLKRQQKRAAEWREQHNAADGKQDGEAEDAKAAKVFMTPAQKRKLAFLHGEFHEMGNSVNAYIVFAHPPPTPSPDTAEGPGSQVLSPYDAAKMAVKECDGSVFNGRTLRVDLVGQAKETNAGVKSVDPKLCVFVGNLDFASKEEDLRSFFETLVKEERGAPPEHDGHEEETDEDVNEDGQEANAQLKTPKVRAWVKSVRIIRDKETQLGKGFAYIQFSDRECVDEILALEPDKLNFAKRKLRVQRCKTLPGAGKADSTKTNKLPAKATSSESNAKGDRRQRPARAKPTVQVPVVPKGDPSLGDRLAGLPKESRKAAKKADADRVARRLAKKKARAAMEKGGVKAQSKDRVRERVVKKDGNRPAPRKKGRVRSDRSMARKNVKSG